MLMASPRTDLASSRITSWVALFIVEALAVRLLAPLPDVWDYWPIVGVAHAIPKVFILSVANFGVLSWTRRAGLVQALKNLIDDQTTSATAAVSASALLIAILFRACLAITPAADGNLLACLYAVSLMIAFASLVLVAVPLPFWRVIAERYRRDLMLSLILGTLGFSAGSLLDRDKGNLLSEDTWAQLSDATLQLSHAILKLLEPDAFMDPATRVLGAKNFSVQVFAACSGYEGMMLIAVFLVGYMLAFRRSLRFPNALILFPLSMAAIWLLNGVRIALLVYIGAHFSPEIALGGFHSQFGWISFLLVSITLMTTAQRMAFFGSRALSASITPLPSPKSGSGVNPATIYLAPFIALMAGLILSNVAAPHEHLLYPIKVVAVAAVIYALRGAYLRIWAAPSHSSCLIGGLAGVLWIATDPGAGTHVPLESSLSSLTPLALVL